MDEGHGDEGHGWEVWVVGLGINRLELLIVPVALVLLWLAIEGVFLLWAFRAAGRAQEERGRWIRWRKREQFGRDGDERLMKVCSWCHGRGRLHAQLGVTLGLLDAGDGYEPECPNCEGAGYLPAPLGRSQRKALRRRLVRQEWKD